MTIGGSDMDAEVWKPLPGWGNRYEVSSLGRVKSLPFSVFNGWGEYTKPERIMGQSPNARNGYIHVMLRFGGKSYCKSVHRLVLEAFVGQCPDWMEGCHNNGDRADNRLENLRWDTPKANNSDKEEHGTVYQHDKTHCPNGHRLELPNLTGWALRGSAKKKPYRRCLSCDRARTRIYDNPELKCHFQEVADSYYRDLMEVDHA